jgi:hypothetical protein
MVEPVKVSVRIIGAAAIMLQCAACATSGSKTIQEMIAIEGGAFRQSGAQLVQLGCYGVQTSGPGHPMECTTVPAWSTVKVRSLPTYAMTDSGKNTLEALANVEADQQNLTGEAKAKFVVEYKGKQKVVTFVIEDRAAVRKDLSAMMVTNPDVSWDLRRGRARIVTAVQKAYDQSWWLKNGSVVGVAATGSFTKIGVPANATVSLTNTNNKEISLNLGDGTTIAYTIDRFCWDGIAKGELGRITTDFPGPDSNACQSGETRIHPRLGSWDHFEQWVAGLFD